jgi:ABC transporter, permease protein
MSRTIGRRRLTLRTRRAFTGLGFLAPWIIGILFFFLNPLVLSLRFSFNRLTLEDGYKLTPVGWSNYFDALRTDENYLPYLTESLRDVLPNMLFILVFSLFVALLLKGKFHGSGIAKAIFFLPVIMSSGLFLSLQAGMDSTLQAGTNAAMESSQQALTVLKSMNLSTVLKEAGFPEQVIEFISGPIDQIYSIMTNSGIQIFIFLAGLNSISPTLYEAAQIESATAWESFWKITFPMILPMILVNAVYSIIDSFTSINNKVMTYVYDMAFTNREFGLSSAMCWLYFLCLGILVGLVALVISRRIHYYA